MGDRRRLDSWKEIAAFLGWSERTIQRYARDRGLPVHKMAGACGRVYAYTDELGRWLARCESKPQAYFSLVVIRGQNAGARLVLDHASVVLGRSFECQLQLQDPGVSRRHAELITVNGDFRIEDLGSRNGTFLNGLRLTAPALLKDGDRIGLGLVAELRLERGQQPETAEEPLPEQRPSESTKGTRHKDD